MAKKLSTILAETRKAEERKITTDEASVLSQIGVSVAETNDSARHAVKHFLASVLEQDEVSDDDAKAALSVLRQAATLETRQLCNRVLSKYVSKFNFAQPKPGKPVAAESAA